MYSVDSMVSAMPESGGLLKALFFIAMFFGSFELAIGASNRGYDLKMLETGQQLFQTNCASCHGVNAEGTVTEWQQKDANGKLPPPPLNGTAHTWHHSIRGLAHTIKNGTVSIGGNMPAWIGKLNDDEIFYVIIWITSLWPDKIYNSWLQINQQ